MAPWEDDAKRYGFANVIDVVAWLHKEFAKRIIGLADAMNEAFIGHLLAHPAKSK